MRSRGITRAPASAEGNVAGCRPHVLTRERRWMKSDAAKAIEVDGGHRARSVQRIEEGNAIEGHERLVPWRTADPEGATIVVSALHCGVTQQRAHEIRFTR